MSLLSLQLYPNLPGEEGLATTLNLEGEHAEASTVRNPIVADLDDDIDRSTAYVSMPPFNELAVVGLNLQPTTLGELLSSGARFLRDLHAKCSYCNELLLLWAPD